MQSLFELMANIRFVFKRGLNARNLRKISVCKIIQEVL